VLLDYLFVVKLNSFIPVEALSGHLLKLKVTLPTVGFAAAPTLYVSAIGAFIIDLFDQDQKAVTSWD
jgi:hypothetical protein